MAQSSCGTISLFSKGRSTKLGFKGHLPWHDAIHGDPIDRAGPIV